MDKDKIIAHPLSSNGFCHIHNGNSGIHNAWACGAAACYNIEVALDEETQAHSVAISLRNNNFGDSRAVCILHLA